jgi:antibiotic biosynthesis monooxygenase (ABM) superfamily enzyme
MVSEMASLERSQGVTVLVTRRPKPGKQDAFEDYIRGITQCAMKHPGHLGANILKSQQEGGEYRILFKFDSRENLELWECSPEREKWRQMAEQVSEPQTVQVQNGLNAWFELPDEGGEAPPHPPKYKMALVVWLSIFTLVVTFTYLFEPLLSLLPFEPRILLLTGVVVFLMTYVVMPNLTRLLRSWLFKP